MENNTVVGCKGSVVVEAPAKRVRADGGLEVAVARVYASLKITLRGRDRGQPRDGIEGGVTEGLVETHRDETLRRAKGT